MSETYSDPEQYPDYKEETYTCDMCNGEGEIEGIQCPQCLGDGWIN